MTDATDPTAPPPAAAERPTDAALRTLLQRVAAGDQPVDSALADLRRTGFTELGFATVDVGRAERRGLPEVIFGQGKTAEHIAAIAATLYAAHGRVLATRLTPEIAADVAARLPDLPARYEAEARCLLIETAPAPVRRAGEVLVVTAGTTDRPVALEAALTARICGCSVRQIDDVGVAGLHRLLAHVDALRAADVIIVVAGMEAALASVVGGLVARPVIAVPTSVGYGASLGGIAALLGMLNACAAGITVVNIDNGFGAGYAAALMRPLIEAE